MTAAVLLIVVACAAPWAFGATEPLFASSAAAAVLLVSLVPLAAAGFRGAPRDELPASARRLAFALPAVALLGLVPIAPALRRLVSPAAAHLLARADPSADGAWRAVSLAPRSTLGAAVLAAACAALFWVVARAARDPSRARRLTALFLAGGAALAVFGLVQRLWDYDPRAVYWRVELPDVATPFGPYVNRNHFAGAMSLFVGVAAGAALEAAATGRRVAAALSAAAGGAALVALAATTSRGALVGVAAGAAFLVIASRRGGRVRAAAVLAVAAGAVVAALFAFGLAGDLLDRVHLAPQGREKNRFAVMWDALRVFAGSPVFGTGAGTFAQAYPPFQTVDDVRFFGNAHSDWAQFLMETGLVGAAFVVAAAREAVSRIRRAAAADSPGRWLVLGPAAGCAAMCVHGLFETNLHVPANALLFASTLSLAYGAAVRDDA